MKGLDAITCPETNDSTYTGINTKEFKQKQENAIARMTLATAEAEKALRALGVAMTECHPALTKIKCKPYHLRSAVGLKRKRGKYVVL